MPDPLGLQMVGGILPLLPPNTSQERQIAAINDILNKLNTWNGVIVKQQDISVTVGAGFYTVSTIAHGLGYRPVPYGFLKGVGLPSTSNSVSLPLPAWLSAEVTGGFVEFKAYTEIGVDEENVYIITLNSTGVAIGPLTITYYLTRLNA